MVTLVLCIDIDIVVIVQLLNYVWLSATPWTTACLAPLFSTVSWSLLKFMSVELVVLTNHLISSFHLLLLPSVFPSIRVICNETYIHTHMDIFSCAWYLFTLLLVSSFYQFKKPHLPLCLLPFPTLNVTVLNISTTYRTTEDSVISFVSTVKDYLKNLRGEGKSISFTLIFAYHVLSSWCSKIAAFITSFLFREML